MALFPCPECQKDVSDKARACPHCGMPLKADQEAAPVVVSPTAGHARRRTLARILGAVLVVLVVGGIGIALRRTDYPEVEQLRAEQDRPGTHDEHVRQRFFRLYNEHPNNAMYIYLWGRCVDDPQKRLDLAEQGIHADPRFSWNYNLAAKALAQLNRVPEAYDRALHGAALDPGNMQLTEKRDRLKAILDHKLTDQAKVAPSAYSTYDKESFDKAAVRYKGLFRGPLRAAAGSDVKAIEKTRVPDMKAVPADMVNGFAVCANPFTDACVRVYATREPISDAGHTKIVWMAAGTDVTALKDPQVVTVAGAVITNDKGENILLADSVKVEAR